ncbi:MAG: TolC family protein [Pirellulaceae bacterium]|nr:TolC family protein [Pirellulaceae bacterium]
MAGSPNPTRSLIALILAALLAGCAGTPKPRAQVAIRPAPPSTSSRRVARLTAAENAAAPATPVDIARRLPTPAASNHASPVQPASFARVLVAAQPTAPLPPPAARGEIIAAPSPVADERPTLPIDFSTALALTQGQNPQVAFAQAQIAQAQAQYMAAKVLWLPNLRGGMNYNKHEGRLQDVRGENITTSRGAAYGGLGAGAVGAASPAIPGVYMQFQLTDALHQPQIRAYGLQASQQRSAAEVNDQLLETALAYLALLEAAQRQAIAAETFRHGEELAQITTKFAQAGAGNQADADRAAAAAALLKNETVRAEEAIAVASARLTQQLSADPAILLTPQEEAITPIDLVPADVPLGDLVSTGLTNRPELAASRSLVGEAVIRLQREKNAPWLPSIILGMSYGSFGAGLGGDITRGGERFDFDGIAYWELRNLGYGEKAARANASAQVRQAKLREVQLLDAVAREVAEAHAQTTARRRQIEVAREAIQSAQQSYERNLQRIRNAQGLPIEVLQSIQALDQARREYLRTIVDYNEAQFRLHRALGWPVAI